MRRLLIVVAAIAVAGGVISTGQEPAPPPRVVAEPRTVIPIPSPGRDADGSPKGIPDYGRFRLYTVEIFVNDRVVAAPGVDYWRDLDELLRGYALRFATSPQQWELTPEGWPDYAKPIAPPKVEVRIKRFNIGGEDWFHPGGRAMPASWDGKLPLVVTVNVGSYRIE